MKLIFIINYFKGTSQMSTRRKHVQWKRVRAYLIPKERSFRTLGCLTVLFFLLPVGMARALDTTEPFDPGFFDAEAYWGYDGLGHTVDSREFSNELILGYGLTSRVSIQGGASFVGQDGYFAGEKSLSLGLFAAAIERDHFDLDLMLDFGATGEGFGDYSISPGIEVNYDRDPDMSSWGLYLRSGPSAFRQWEGVGGDTRRRRGLLDYGLNPGAYLRLSPRHELLVEYDLSLALGKGRSADETAQLMGLGFNMQISEALELVSQIQHTFPRGGEKAKFGIAVGFIATLPSGK